MEDVDREEPELGDRVVHGPVGKTAFLLEHRDELAHIIPAGSFRRFPRNRVQVVEISGNIGGIRLDGVVGETAESDHLTIKSNVIHKNLL